MGTRLELHDILSGLLESNNVYYQPPETIKMEYPCIKYSKSNIRSKYANNLTYVQNNCYEIIVISKKPDNPVINELLKLPMCSFNRHYVSDNLNHDVLTLYF